MRRIGDIIKAQCFSPRSAVGAFLRLQAAKEDAARRRARGRRSA